MPEIRINSDWKADVGCIVVAKSYRDILVHVVNDWPEWTAESEFCMLDPCMYILYIYTVDLLNKV